MYEQYQRFFNGYIEMFKEYNPEDLQLKNTLAKALQYRLYGMVDLMASIEVITYEAKFEECDKIKETFKL